MHSALWSFHYGACKSLARECVGLEKWVSSGGNKTCSSSGVFSDPRHGQDFVPVASASLRDGAGMAPVRGLTPFMLKTPHGARVGLVLQVCIQGWWHMVSWGGENHLGPSQHAGGWLLVRCEADFPVISKAASGETVGACCELSLGPSSEDASQAFPVAGESSSAAEKLPRCFLFILLYF